MSGGECERSHPGPGSSAGSGSGSSVGRVARVAPRTSEIPTRSHLHQSAVSTYLSMMCMNAIKDIYIISSTYPDKLMETHRQQTRHRGLEAVARREQLRRAAADVRHPLLGEE